MTPVVIRTMWGAGLRAAAQHSQSLLPDLHAHPRAQGRRAVDAYDAKGLLIQAIRDDDPVIFFEHKVLYDVAGRRAGGELRDPVRRGQHRARGRRRHDRRARAHGAHGAGRPPTRARGDGHRVRDHRPAHHCRRSTWTRSSRVVENTGRLVVVDEANPRCCSPPTSSAHGRAGRPSASLRAPIADGDAPHTPVPFAARSRTPTSRTPRAIAAARSRRSRSWTPMTDERIRRA